MDDPLGIWPSGARENSPHLAEVRIPSALPKQCVRVCSVDCYRQIKKGVAMDVIHLCYVENMVEIVKQRNGNIFLVYFEIVNFFNIYRF